MSPLLAAPGTVSAVLAAADPGTRTGTGEAVVFWVLAPVMVLASLGMLLSKKAVHSALLLALTMVSLAILYITQDAPFLGVVQVVVYTGAVMMLFLFVLMLVGVDSSDSLVETLRGQRVAALLAAAGFAVLLIAGLGRASFAGSAGLAQANAGGNVQAIAALLFTRYVYAFEVTSALLITAALGAMVLTHRERQETPPSQREMAERRIRGNQQVPPLPSPGVYARHNAVDIPALLPDGSPSELSVPTPLSRRGAVRSAAPVATDVVELERRATGVVRRQRHLGGDAPTDAVTAPPTHASGVLEDEGPAAGQEAGGHGVGGLGVRGQLGGGEEQRP